MEQSLLKFPCSFTIKVVGISSDEFENNIIKIVKKHVPNFSRDMMKTRKSKNKKYSSLNIEVYVTSKEQLDNLYRELSASPYVLVAL